MTKEKNLTDEYRNLATKAKYNDEFKKVHDEIQEFMNEERRTWSSAMLILLEWGLEEWQKRRKTT